MNLVPYTRVLQDKGGNFTVVRRLMGVEKTSNHLTAAIGTDYNDTEMKQNNRVVVKYGMLPLDEF